VRSARRLYRLGLALALTSTLALLAGAIAALGHIDLAVPAGAQLLRDCWRLLLPQLTPAAATVILVEGLGALVLVRALRSAGRQLRAARRFVGQLPVSGRIHVGSRCVLVFAGSEPHAFCAGLWRPQIYLSRGALELLEARELAAVVAHEAHHAARRDPARILLLEILTHALFFLPALRRLELRYRQLAEIAADESALAATGDPSPLAAALLRFEQSGAPGVIGIAPERVDHLLGVPSRWNVGRGWLAGALMVTITLVLVTVVLAHSPGQVQLAALAARSCMLVMLAWPALALAAAELAARYGRASRARKL